jgi:hypothetical protein
MSLEKSDGIGGARKVKELEWEDRGYGLFYAQTPFGTYKASLTSWWFEDEPSAFVEVQGSGKAGFQKAAAQQDFEKRIMSALSPAMLSASPSISGEPKWCEACGTVTADKECDCTTFPETAHLQKLGPLPEQTPPLPSLPDYETGE